MSGAPLPTRLSLLRIVSQGLVSPTRATSVEEAVSGLLALQGQQVSAIPHALVARTAAAAMPEVAAAFGSARLVRSWPMRGTVHVTTAGDHHWLRAALAHTYDRWVASTRELGIDDAVRDAAAAVARAEIASRGPLTRSELLAAWEGAGLIAPVEVDYGAHPMSESFARSWWRRHMILLLHLEGILVQGPIGANEHLVVDASSLPSADEGPIGAGVAKGGPRHLEALAEIARRYALGHGPVSAHDLARWTGLGIGQSHRALEDALEASSSGSGPALVRIRVDRGAKGEWEREEAAPRSASPDVLYMRADAEDLLADCEKEAAATRFLGAFDELHVGYKDRTCLVDDAGETLICPAKNGMFRPIVIERGRLVAVRPVREGLLYAGAREPSSALKRRVEKSVGAVLARLS